MGGETVGLQNRVKSSQPLDLHSCNVERRRAGMKLYSGVRSIYCVDKLDLFLFTFIVFLKCLNQKHIKALKHSRLDC